MPFIGFMTILVITGVLSKGAMLSASDAAVLAAISTVSPWLASHAEIVGWIAAGIVFIAGMVVPPILINKDIEDGQDRIEEVGNFAGAVSLAYALIFLAIPGVGYLLGMGWFAARKAAGL